MANLLFKQQHVCEVSAPRGCVPKLIPLSALFSLAFGTLYPAYSSYKAVKTKNVKEYVSITTYIRADLLLTLVCPLLLFFDPDYCQLSLHSLFKVVNAHLESNVQIP